MNLGGWLLAHGDGLPDHVIPINDLREHVEHSSCWCNPHVESDGLVVHSAMDRRELYESGKLKLS